MLESKLAGLHPDTHVSNYTNVRELVTNSLGVNLIPAISDKALEEMLKTLRPIIATDGEKYDCWKCVKSREFHLIDISKVHRRKQSYVWGAKRGDLVKIPWKSPLCSIPTFHRYGAPSLFKPSLAEVYGCIRAAVPDWHLAAFVSLELIHEDYRDIWGNYHMAKATLYGPVLQLIQ